MRDIKIRARAAPIPIVDVSYILVLSSDFPLGTKLTLLVDAIG